MLHPHEEATIRAFIIPRSQSRWLEKLATPKMRTSIVGRLSDPKDIDDRYGTPLSSNEDIVAVLRTRGAPSTCFVISENAEIDGREMPLIEAVFEAEVSGLGTILSCIPGRLAYFYGEALSEGRMVLER